jgi:DNA repair exonuclease SbcCD ATPase subunit
MRIFCITAALSAALWIGSIGPAASNDDGDRLKLRALSEEAGLILDEQAQLQPLTEKLAKEGEQLDAVEQMLRAESNAVNDSVNKYNEANKGLERAFQEHAQRCPKESDDKALVESCNAMAVGLKGTAQKLEQERPALQARQQELKQRIEQHNAARKEWAQRRRDHDARLQANRGDCDHWVTGAKPFLASEGFKALAKKAGNPPACEVSKLTEAMAMPQEQAVARVQSCLKALAPKPQSQSQP